MPMTLAGIQLIEVTDSRHYFPTLDHDGLLYLATALAGEVGETCNLIKKWYRDSWTLEQIQNELAKELPDILIYLVMLAGAANIDLDKAYEAKKEYNNERFGRAVAETE